jgi:MarR family transcriptional regulator, transcriptional regulator for hemolysin
MATTTPADVDLAFLLNQASHALATKLTAALAELDVTPRHHCVLTKAMTGEYTQGQLAELTALDKTTMVVTLDELEAKGLAERRPSPTDRRARVIAVTDAGRELVAAAQAIAEDVHADVLSTLPEDERGPFMDALGKLVGQRLMAPVECARPVRRRAQRVPA